MNRPALPVVLRLDWRLVALGWLALVIPTAGVQAAQGEDPRWAPWYGCWEPRGAPQPEGADLLLCILPEEAGVTLSTWIDGERVETDLLQANAGAILVEEAGCMGTRTLAWSEDGARLFLEGQVTCEPGWTRASRGLFALTDDGYTWVEIQALGMEEDGAPILSVRSFHPASPASLERHGIDALPALERRGLQQQLRQQAARPLNDAAIIEANQRAGGAVAAALVAEMGHPFALSTNRLRALRQAGVSAEVVDVMVAVTWPRQFEIRADGRVGQAPPPAPVSTQRPSGYGYGSPSYRVRYGYGYGLFWNPYLGYSYGAPGYGYGYSSYPWYSGPAYIVVPPASSVAPSGTMTPSGYRPSSSRTARPGSSSASERPSTPANNPPPARSTAPATQSPPPASSSPDRRPAVPRTGGGGSDPQP